MRNKQILRDIVRQQIKIRGKQYTSLKFLTVLLCFFLTSICVILYNEMQIIGNGREFEYVTIGMLFLVFLFFFSFYSIAYLNFSREKKNYDSLMKIGLTNKDLKKSMKYFGRYLTGGHLLISGGLGTCLGLVVTWKYKTFASLLLSIFIIFIIYYCIQMALKLCMGKLIKSFKSADKRIHKTERHSTDRLNIFTMAMKYLSYNASRTAFVVIVLLFSGILLNFAFSTAKSMNIDKYISDNWGKQNYRMILNKEGDTTGEYNQLQIDNPLTKDLQEDILSIDGIEKVIPKLSMSTSFELDNEKIDTSLNSMTNGVKKNSGLEHISKDEVVISINESLLKDGEKKLKGKKIACEIWDGDVIKRKEFIVASVYIDNSKGLRIYAQQDTILALSDYSPVLSFDIYGKESDSTRAYLQQLINGKNLLLDSKSEYEESARMGLMMLKAGIFIVMILLVLFAVTTALNTKFMNIFSRKNDLKALTRLGMSESDIVQMLTMEDWLCNVPIVIISGVLGNALSYIVCDKMDETGATFMIFNPTISGTFWCIVLFLIISVIGTRIYKAMQK